MNKDTEQTFNSTEDRLPQVSVVIISKNNHTLLEQAVASVGVVDYPREKLQMVVLEETDTPLPLESWIDYHTIPLRHRGFGFARNQALLHAHNPLIVFTDDDCVVHRSWIRNLVEPLLGHDEVSAVAGAVFVPPCGPVGECENIIGFPGGGMHYYHLAGGTTVRRPTFSTCNCAIWRSAIDVAGGFDESMKFGGEDENISRHIAEHGGIIYQPDAIVYHQPRDSLLKVYKWFARRGYAEVHQAIIDRQSRYPLIEFLKNAIVLRVALLAVFSVVTRIGGPLFFSLVLCYYGVLFWKFRWARRYYPAWSTRLLVPLVRMVMDAGRDWGIVKGLVDVRKKTSVGASERGNG